MTALFAASFWAWKQHEGWLRFLLAFLLPVLIAAIWGVFAVPNDPSRSGKTVVVTPGWIRLIIELAIFSFAVWAFFDLRYFAVAYIFLSLIIAHYLFSLNRIKWLLRQ
jgi:hypothetical protein